jgi:phosphoribosylglycinamide formyltransferase-1
MSLKIAVLASGGGRSLQNLLEREARGELPIEIVCVGVSKAGCGAEEKARLAGRPVFVRGPRRSESIEQRSAEIFAELRRHKAEYVCLAGYLQRLLIPEDFLLRVLNIHPALIPAFSGQGFYGMKVHEAAWAAGVKISGCTLHFCDDQYDHGPIILQRAVDVSGAKSPAEIAALVFAAELELYPEALALIAAGRVRVNADGRSEVHS